MTETDHKDTSKHAQKSVATHDDCIADESYVQGWERVVRLAAQACGASVALIGCVSDGRVRVKAVHGCDHTPKIAPEDPVSAIFETKESGFFGELRKRPGWSDESVIRSIGAGAIRWVPLVDVLDRVRGTLCVFWTDDDCPGPGSKALLDDFASLAMEFLATQASSQTRMGYLHESERNQKKRFDQLVDALPVITWISTPDGNVHQVGNMFSAYCGVSMERLSQPGSWLEVLHPDDREPTIKRWMHSVNTGEFYSTEFRIRRRDGAYRWHLVSARAAVNDVGEIQEWFGCVQEFHDRKIAEEEVESIARIFSDTLESISDAFFTLDGDGRVRFINNHALFLFGVRRAGCQGLPLAHALPQLGDTTIEKDCIRALSGGQVRQFETYFEPLKRWLEVGLYPTHDGVAVSLRDIESRKRDEIFSSVEVKIFDQIAQDAAIEETLALLMNGIEQARSGLLASIHFFDASNERFRDGAAPSLPKAYNRAIDAMQVGPTSSSPGAAVYCGEPVFIADMMADGIASDSRFLAKQFKLRASWAWPVVGTDNEPIAVLTVHCREPQEPDAFDLELLGRASNLAGLAITRYRERKACRLSEERFRSIFQDAATGMAIVTPDGRYLDANQAYCDMLGYALPQLCERDLLSLTHPDDRAESALFLKRMLTSGQRSAVCEKRYLTSSGETVWAFLSVTVQHDAGKPVRFVAIAEDVTAQHQASEKLERQSSLLRMASRLGQLGGWSYEIATECLVWSDEVQSLHGLKLGEQPTLEEAFAFYAPNSQPLVREAFDACLSNGTPYDLELAFISAQGRPFFARSMGEAVRDSKGAVVRIEGAFQNVTERHKLLVDLAESEERFRQLAEYIDDVFWIKEPFDTRVLYVSSAYEKIWGRSVDSLYDNPVDWMNAIIDSDWPVINAHSAQLPDKEYVNEYRIIRPDGEIRWIVDRGFPVRDAQGCIHRIVGVARDVTKSKRAEQMILETMDKLRKSNRELEDFAYVASHDLQEPLRKIRSFSDRIKTVSDRLGERERDYLERMERAASRMQSLILDLLQYSRVSTRELTMCDVPLDSVLDEVLLDFDTLIAETGARIERETLPKVKCDRRQMQQLLHNLISNALKFHKPDEVPRVRIYAPFPEKGQQLCVSDDGIGIEPRFVDRILRPFQRLHGRSEYEGTGIGLAIVKKIVDGHGAQLTVSGASGQGARFCVHFADRRGVNVQVGENSDTHEG